MIHLLAELIENATLFSPVEHPGRGSGRAGGQRLRHRGRTTGASGIPADQLRELNAQLASPPDFDLADADRLGLFVAGRLAARHGVHVSLAPSPYRGTKAVVVLPDAIVVPDAGRAEGGSRRTASGAGPARLNLRAPQVLSLADPVQPEPGRGRRRRPEPRRRRPRPATDALHGLPQRVRPASQPAGDDADRRCAAPGSPGTPRSRPRSPDDARSLAASLQSSWHRSRQRAAAGPGCRPWPRAAADASTTPTTPHSTTSEA